VGETASTWKLPLHSSDSEHHWMKIRESKGAGGPLGINRADGGGFPDDYEDVEQMPHNGSSVLTNPFHHTSEPKPNATKK
jgi:hypothetical protein